MRYVPDAMEITIYTKASGSGVSSIFNGDYGHAFVEIGNYTGRAVTVGARSIPNNSTMTIGRWKTNEHSGIYYNLEALKSSQHGNYYYKTCSLSETARANIHNWLKNTSNNKWQLNANCSHLAITLWNYAAPSSEDFNLAILQTPTELESQFKIIGYDGYGRPDSASTAYYASGSTAIQSRHTVTGWYSP